MVHQVYTTQSTPTVLDQHHPSPRREGQTASSASMHTTRIWHPASILRGPGDTQAIW
ncbi:hypothetical protein BDW02DRAFT_37905 [Decorospora gaudefroyi]|uniref:Uncharacterized protein n=1 Tax=Decorospora gaudefroyi TaxID=184978 RepID=A0A6A5K604_9PLEO|nr:hypothetical protein BDW02DRAFT_37905 [Decorospora gaudefroyi]